EAGDALLVDFGARAGGVCADITRTFFVGHCSDAHAAVYETVLAANLAGHAASRPGATAHEVDDAATKVLENSAFAERIRHKTGHGLGRDIHEDPYIMRGNDQTLETGMVFTIEPGLYDLQDIGIRIEDDVLVTGSGSESLTGFDKSLTLVG
ncbi:MAG: M24 family metallopeptidase, partial [Granulosicoccus sp.]|nr:M24 family metallopeptidase [Granulosicoccus sp.]